MEKRLAKENQVATEIDWLRKASGWDLERSQENLARKYSAMIASLREAAEKLEREALWVGVNGPVTTIWGAQLDEGHSAPFESAIEQAISTVQWMQANFDLDSWTREFGRYQYSKGAIAVLDRAEKVGA